MGTIIAARDANKTTLASLPPQLIITAMEFLRLSSMFTRANYRFYIANNPDESNPTRDALFVLENNYYVGNASLCVVGSSLKVKVVPKYGDSEEGLSVNPKKMARYMVECFTTPSAMSDAIDIGDNCAVAAGKSRSEWHALAHRSYREANTKTGYIPVYEEFAVPIVQRVLDLIDEGGPTTALVREKFAEWIEADFPERVRRMQVAQRLEKRIKTTIESSAPYSTCAFVRIWEDGSGVFITGNERHYLSNPAEQLPREVFEKIALLKVSGLSCIEGVGVHAVFPVVGSVKSNPDNFIGAPKESIYFIVRD